MNNKEMQLAGLSPLKKDDEKVEIPKYIDAPLTEDMQNKYNKMYRQQDDDTLSANTFNVTTEKGMIDYLKHTENSIKAGYDSEKDRWFPHKDNKGIWTIGYGHNISASSKTKEHYKDGLTTADVEKLLKSDIETHTNLLKANIPEWDDLSKLQKNALLDIQFNIIGNVWSKFKNFTKAVVNKDWQNLVLEGSRKEYENNPNQRNTAFYKSMIEPLMKEWRPQIQNPDFVPPENEVKKSTRPSFMLDESYDWLWGIMND